MTVKSFDIWGRPDDFNPTNGVNVTLRVLGPELPTPAEYIDAMKALFKGEYFILPDEERKLPEDCNGAVYLGSVMNRYIHYKGVFEDGTESTTMHYFLLNDEILSFDNEWELNRPRSLLISYESILKWKRMLRPNE